jgi:hypothetical protein
MRIIKELRILPPLTIARLGSSDKPMDNYKLTIVDPIDFRRLEPTDTFVVSSGRIVDVFTPNSVDFRDSDGRIRPVCPFLEVWAQFDDSDNLEPLTVANLKSCGLKATDVTWNIEVANFKAFRRTNDENDRIFAQATFSDHAFYPLVGNCNNFKEGKTISLGGVQYLKPNSRFPGLRLRFTPGKGFVYGSEKGTVDPLSKDDVYDVNKGHWDSYQDRQQQVNIGVHERAPLYTFPAGTYQGQRRNPDNSGGYFDDTCDGIVEVKIGRLSAYSRICSAVPSFTPDSLHVRTLADDLEQLLEGPELLCLSKQLPGEATDILRRALETLRLMNTAVMNGDQIFNGIKIDNFRNQPRYETEDFARKYDPVWQDADVSYSTVLGRHIAIIHLWLDGKLTTNMLDQWIRKYDQAGDLSSIGRQKMPAMMRGSDRLPLALTRRQRDKLLKATASDAKHFDLDEQTQSNAISPINLSAQLHYKPHGNPPSSSPITAVGNYFPGLELDLRNLWRRIFEGIVLHESLSLVVAAEQNEFSDLVGFYLTKVDGKPVLADLLGPPNPPNISLGGEVPATLELSNALADLFNKGGDNVECEFRALRPPKIPPRIVTLTVRKLLAESSEGNERMAVINREVAEPGELTQSLCSPWQNDYVGCSCYYWAASRPDFVNFDGNLGHNWIQTPESKAEGKGYVAEGRDRNQDARLLQHEDLIREWETKLHFVINGKEEDN